MCRCASCDKILSSSEMGITGYNTGEPLFLCNSCAPYVNNAEEAGKTQEGDEIDNVGYMVADEAEVQEALTNYLRSISIK